MKTIRIILIFLMLLLPFAGWWLVIFFKPMQFTDQPYPFLTIMGIGQIAMLLGVIGLLILDRWGKIQLDLKELENSVHEKDIAFKKQYLETQQKDAEQRRAHEARKQPDKEIATIIQSAKTRETYTREPKKKEKEQKVPSKETTEKETIDHEMVNGVLEHFKQLANNNNENT
jgi:hypothetical protein